MAKPTANMRLFVAAYPPADSVQAMLACMQSLALPAHRLTAAEQVHLTVQFIGDTPSKDLDATVESVQRAAAGLRSFTLQPLRLLALPERGPKRLIALETDLPSELMELHRRLVIRLARNARPRAADRFRPHFTLCRFRTQMRGLSLDQPISIGSFQIGRIFLMRSALSSDGATHHQVASCELEP